MCQVTFPETHLSISLRKAFLTVGNFLREIYQANYFPQCFWAKWSFRNSYLSLPRNGGTDIWDILKVPLAVYLLGSGNEDGGKEGEWSGFALVPSPEMLLCLGMTWGLSPLQQASFTWVLFAWSTRSCSFSMVSGNNLYCVWWLILITSLAGFRIIMEMSLISFIDFISYHLNVGGTVLPAGVSH